MSESLESLMANKKKLENMMHKYLGFSNNELYHDITEKMDDSFLDFDILSSLNYKHAKNEFTKRYFARLLRKHNGNITLAAKEANVHRRTIHRIIQKYKIDLLELRSHTNKEYTSKVESVIESYLKNNEYRLNDDKLYVLYKNIPSLTKEIIDQIYFDTSFTFAKAKKEFERRFIFKTLEKNNNNVLKTSRDLGIRPETIHRKIKKLKIID